MRTFDKPRSAGGLCLYKASIAGPSKHCKVIKHFVITRYINSQQSSGITFPPSHSVWPVSLDFLLALFQIQMEYVDTGRLSCGRLWALFWTWSTALLTLLAGKGRHHWGAVRTNGGSAVKNREGSSGLAVFMNGPIMSHQERGGHENMKGDKR